MHSTWTSLRRRASREALSTIRCEMSVATTPRRRQQSPRHGTSSVPCRTRCPTPSRPAEARPWHQPILRRQELRRPRSFVIVSGTVPSIALNPAAAAARPLSSRPRGGRDAPLADQRHRIRDVVAAGVETVGGVEPARDVAGTRRGRDGNDVGGSGSNLDRISSLTPSSPRAS